MFTLWSGFYYFYSEYSVWQNEIRSVKPVCRVIRDHFVIRNNVHFSGICFAVDTVVNGRNAIVMPYYFTSDEFIHFYNIINNPESSQRIIHKLNTRNIQLYTNETTFNYINYYCGDNYFNNHFLKISIVTGFFLLSVYCVATKK